MLASNDSVGALAMASIGYNALVLELSLLSSKGVLGVLMVAVVEFSVLDGTKFCGVCLRKNLTILNWLDSAVVVILVDLLVDGSVDLLMYVRLDGLVLHSRGDRLVNSSVMVTRLAHEVADCCLGLIHFDDVDDVVK
jgi:hypothetical protein